MSWLLQKPNKITLLLNSKIDGDSCKTMIEKCKGKKPTLIVIQTTKDIIFGGYITQEWNADYKDEKAFVYFLKARKKYKVKEPNYENMHVRVVGRALAPINLVLYYEIIV